MNSSQKFTVSALIIAFAFTLVLIATSCSKPVEKHTCKWDSCPYKGIKPDQWKVSVLDYIGKDAEGSDSYYIDLLHLEYPIYEYEQLEDMLFQPMREYDYQLKVTNDSIFIYSGKRQVKAVIWSKKNNYSPIETALIEDNL